MILIISYILIFLSVSRAAGGVKVLQGNTLFNAGVDVGLRPNNYYTPATNTYYYRPTSTYTYRPATTYYGTQPYTTTTYTTYGRNDPTVVQPQYAVPATYNPYVHQNLVQFVPQVRNVQNQVYPAVLTQPQVQHQTVVPAEVVPLVVGARHVVPQQQHQVVQHVQQQPVYHTRPVYAF